MSTKFHGFFDYLSGLLLIAAPWVLQFANDGPEQWTPIIIGSMIIIMSIFTDYEVGIIKVISMPTHLTINLLAGIALAISPWVLGYYQVVYLPHLLVGLLEVGVSLMTDKEPRQLS